MRGVVRVFGWRRRTIAIVPTKKLRCFVLLATLTTCAVVVTSSGLANAQETDRVLAEALFREGRELMDAGKVAEACTKFGESYRMDRALGTLINLALCHEKEGKTATAWAEFNEAAADAAAEKDDREIFARRHIAALIPELPRLRLVIAPAASAVETLEIRLDGHILGRAAWSSPLPIDPGEHELTASGENKRSFSAKFTVPKGPGTTNASVPALDEAQRPITIKPDVPDNTNSSAGKTQRWIGYAAGGVGVVGLVVGAGFGLSAISLKGDRDGRCSSDHLCDQEGVDKDKDARRAATISTIGFMAGGALAVGGVVLVLTAPKSSAQTQVGVNVNGRGVFFGGAF